MNDQQFEKMDEQWMKSMKPLREKGISDGILKGFSVSVERRIAQDAPKAQPIFSTAWVPAMAVMVLASLVVLRLPVRQAGSPVMDFSASQGIQGVEYAQLSERKTEVLEDEIAALKELGAWSEEDESLLGNDVSAEELELSSNYAGANIA